METNISIIEKFYSQFMSSDDLVFDIGPMSASARKSSPVWRARWWLSSRKKGLSLGWRETPRL